MVHTSGSTANASLTTCASASEAYTCEAWLQQPGYRSGFSWAVQCILDAGRKHGMFQNRSRRVASEMLDSVHRTVSGTYNSYGCA